MDIAHQAVELLAQHVVVAMVVIAPTGRGATLPPTYHQEAAGAVADLAVVQGRAGPVQGHQSLILPLKWFRLPQYVKQLKFKQRLNRIFEIAFYGNPPIFSID